MGRVLTNRLSMAFGVEPTLGAAPTTYKLLEPNGISSYGATISKIVRDPISKDRQRRKGTTVDLDSAVEFEHDLTREVFKDFVEGFAFAGALHPFSGTTTRQKPLKSGALFDNLAADNDAPPAGVDAGYTHNAISQAFVANRLVFARGFTDATNNGLKVIIAGSTTTATLISTALVDETPGNTANASIEIAGHRAATGDLAITVSGSPAVATITSTALNFTTLGLTVGQFVHVGGLTSANWFSATNRGYGRIKTIAANTLTLDNIDSTLATDTGVGDTVDLLYGAWVRNVAVDHADFLERSYQFELKFPGLQNPSGDEFEYAKGNIAATMSLQVPLADKALVTWGFIGTDTPAPTVTQQGPASTPQNPVETTAYNTSSDISRLRIKDSSEGLLTSCLKDVTISLDNEVSAEKCLGTLAATFMNQGKFLVNLEGQVLLTDSKLLAAVRNNTTVAMDGLFRNDNGAIAFDIPSMTLGDGSLDLPVNESVITNVSGEAFKDVLLGYSISFSLFPQVPLV